MAQTNPNFKSHSEFPYIKEFADKFNINNDTIFAYKDSIYSEKPLSEDLIIHEITHLNQQSKHIGGADKWIEDYLNNPMFRLEQEIEAYREQLKSINDRNKRTVSRFQCANFLSSSLYGRIITKEQALEMLKV